MADVVLKQHDTGAHVALVRNLQQTIDGVTSAINLTGASSVKFLMKHSTGSPVISGLCTVLDATQGQVRYTWVSGDTNTIGTYDAEFEITWAAGDIETVPNGLGTQTYFSIEVKADLG
jgi:hypothetical protein